MDNARRSCITFYNFVREKIGNFNRNVSNALDINKRDNSILVLDGLRAIACLSVLFFHYRWLSAEHIVWWPTQGSLIYVTGFLLFGGNGIILFFLLSGFLLFLPFAKALLFKDSKWPSIRRFYLRRIFRIIPAYYVALILLILFTHPDFLELTQWRVLANFLTLRMNYQYAQQINGVFWTLVVEFQFYLLLPLIAWVMSLVVRSGSTRWRLTKLTLCLLIMIGWGVVTRYWALHIVDTTKLDWLLPHSVGVTLRSFLYGNPAYDASGRYFEVFGIGMLLCMFYVYSRNTPQTARRKRVTQLLGLFCALIGLSSLAFVILLNLYFINIGTSPILQYLFSSHQNSWRDIWNVYHPFLTAIGYGLCMFALLQGPKWLKRPFEWSPLRWVGAISYSLYIWHMPLASLFLGYSFPSIQNRSYTVQYMISLLWILIVIIPFSVASYRCIEQPGIRLGESILRRIEKRKKTPDVVPEQPRIRLDEPILLSIAEQKKTPDVVPVLFSQSGYDHDGDIPLFLQPISGQQQ